MATIDRTHLIDLLTRDMAHLIFRLALATPDQTDALIGAIKMRLTAIKSRMSEDQSLEDHSDALYAMMSGDPLLRYRDSIMTHIDSLDH